MDRRKVVTELRSPVTIGILSCERRCKVLVLVKKSMTIWSGPQIVLGRVFLCLQASMSIPGGRPNCLRQHTPVTVICYPVGLHSSLDRVNGYYVSAIISRLVPSQKLSVLVNPQ